ncbi:MAG: hypothetical protein ABI378_01115 [Chitinophagaceae bacterium]
MKTISKKWMTSKLFLLFLFYTTSTFAQSTDTSIGYFDMDDTIDSLFYHFQNTPSEGPTYACEMRLGNGKIHNFLIGVAIESLGIYDCGKGCIITYELHTGIQGYREIRTYKYNLDCDNWILYSIKTIKLNPRKTKIEFPRGKIGIDGVKCISTKATKKNSIKCRKKNVR